MSYKRLSSSEKDLILERVRFYLTTFLDKEAFKNPSDLAIQDFYNLAEERFYINLRLMLVGREVKSTVIGSVVYPASLWSHIKKCLKERLPKVLSKYIRWKKVVIPRVIKEWHICPHINVSGKGSHIQFLKGDFEKGRKYDE